MDRFNRRVISSFGYTQHNYTGKVTSSDQPFYNLITTSDRIEENFKISRHAGISVDGSKKALDNLSKVINIVENGGVLYGMDLETLGSLQDGASQMEQNMFAVTEAIIKRKSYIKSPNGSMHTVVDDVQNIVFGINEKQKNAYVNLLYRFENRGDLTSAEKSTMRRLGRLGASLNSNGRLDFKNGMYVMGNPGVHDEFDVSNIIKGINELRRIGVEGYTYDNLNDASKGKIFFKNFVKDLEKYSSNGNIMVGYNSHTFDMPLVEKMAKNVGLDFKLGDGSIDLFEIGKVVGFDFTKLYDGTGVKSNYGREENIARLLKSVKGEVEDFHNASFDVEVMLRLLDEDIETTGETLVKHFRNKAEKNLEGLSKISSNSGLRFRAVNPLSLSKLDGSYAKEGEMVFDFVTEKAEDGNTYINKFKQGTLLANNIYNFEDVKVIPVEKLPRHIAKQVEGSEYVYAATFSKALDENGSKSVIIRKDLKDIQSIFENNLEVFAGSDEVVKAEHQAYKVDAARRKVEGFMQVNGGGYKEAKRYTDAYYALQQEAFERGMDPLNKEQVAKLVANGSFTSESGKVIMANKALKPLTNSDGVLYKSQAETFATIFGYLDQTAPISKDLIDVIEVHAKNQGNDFKTLAYKNGFEKVLGAIAEQGEDLGFMFKTEHDTTLRNSFGIRISLNGEEAILDASSKTRLRKSIKNLSEKGIAKSVNEKTYNSNVNKRLNEIYKELYSKKIISKEEMQELSKIGQHTYSYNRLTDNVFDYVNKKVEDLSSDQLASPKTAKEEIDKKIKDIKKSRKDINEKYKKYKDENKKYAGLDGEKNLNKDLKDLKEKLDVIEKAREDFIKNTKPSDLFAGKKIDAQYDDAAYKEAKKEYKRLENYKKVLQDKERITAEAKSLSNLEKQSKGLKWVMNNTTAEGLEKLDVINGPRITMNEGKIGLKDFHLIEEVKEQVTGSGIGYKVPIVKQLGVEAIAETTKIHGKVTTKVHGEYQNAEAFKNYLKGSLYYTEDEAEALSIRLSGPAGILNRPDSKGNKDLAFAVVEQFDELNPTKKSAKLVITKDTALNSVINAVEDGDFGDKAVVINLPVAEKINGARFVKKDGLVRVDYSGIDIYVKNSKKVADDMVKVNVKSKSLIAETINAIGFSAEQIPLAIEENKGSLMTSKVRQSMNNIFTKAPGPTGYKYVKTKDGEVVKRLLVNTGDISKNSNYDLSTLINFVPFLYEENKEFQEKIDTILSKDVNFTQGTAEYFKDWQDKLLKNDGAYGVKKNLDEVHKGIKEFFIVNFLGGDEILGQILDSDFIKRMDIDAQTIATLEDIRANGSQVISEVKVGELIVTSKSVENMTYFGDVSGANRPTIVQGNQYEHIQIDNLSDKEIKRLERKGVTLGRTLEANDSDVKHLLKANIGKYEEEFVEGITAKFKTIEDKEILERLNKLEGNIDKDMLNKFRQKIALDSVDDAVLAMSDEELTKAIKGHIRTFKSQGSTFMQRTIVSPVASTVLATDTYHDINLNDLTDIKLNIGDEVKTGTVIGINELGNEVTYKNKRAGKIVGMSDGKYHVQEYAPAIQEVKLNTGVVEKGIAHVFNYENDIELNIAQAIWEEAFGEDVSMLGSYEFKKHLSAGFAYNDITATAQEVLKTGNENLIKEFEEQIAKISNGDVATEVLDRYNGKAKAFLYGLNLNADEDVFSKYEDVVNYYRQKAEDPNADEFYKRLGEKLKHNAENEEYVAAVSLMQLNRQYGSQVDDLIDVDEIVSDHGGKMAYRDLYHFGRKPGRAKESRDLFFKRNGEGALERTAEPLVKHFEKMISESKDYDDALKDIINIRYAGGLSAGLTAEQIFKDNIEIAKDLKIESIDLNDVRLHGANFNEEDMLRTLFGEFRDKDTNVVEIDLGDMQIKNPLHVKGSVGSGMTAEKVNKVYIPINKLNYVDDMFIPNNVQKASVNLIDNLQKASQYGDGTSPMVSLSNANIAYRKLFEAYDFELKNKDGIVRQKLMSSRIDFSGHQLFGKVFSADYNADGSHINDIYNKNSTIKVLLNGKKVDAPLDIEFFSKRSFEEMAGKDFIKNLGEQLVNENDFDSNARFKKHLKDIGVKLTGDIDYEKVGEEYLKTEGIQALSKRYPVFHPNAQITVLARLRDDDLDTTSVYTHAYTAMKLKADIDGDMKQTTLLVERGADGKVKMFNRGDKRREAFEDMLMAEAIDNRAYWMEKAIKEQDDIRAEHLITMEAFREEAMKKGATSGNWASNDSKMMKAKVRIDKEAIGYISTPAQYVNEIGSHIFTGTKGHEDLDMLQDLQDFLQTSEQKLISSKHMTKEEALNSVSAGVRWGQGISLMAKGEVEDGLDIVADALSTVGLFDPKSFDMEKIKSATYRADEDILNDPMAKGLGALYNVFKNPEAEKIWNNPDFRTAYVTRANMAETFPKLISGDFEANTYLTNATKEMYKKANSDYDKGTIKSISLPTDKLYIDKTGTTYGLENGFAINDKEVVFDAVSNVGSNRFSAKSIKDIDNTLERAGAYAIDVSKMSTEDIDIVKSTDFGLSYAKGRGILNQLENDGVITKEYKENVLSSYNEELIKRGREAKSFNREKAEALNREIFDEAMNKFRPSMTAQGKENLFNTYYSDDALLNGTLLNKSFGKSYTVKDTSDIFGGRLNDKLESIGAFSEELQSRVRDRLSQEDYSSLDEGLRQKVGERAVSRIQKPFEEALTEKANHITSKLQQAYINEKADFRTFYGWDKDFTQAYVGIDLKGAQNVARSLETVRAFGEARIGSGTFTGYKASELSFDELNSAIDELKVRINSSSNGANKEFYKENVDALNNYKKMVYRVQSQNSVAQSSEVQDFIKEASSSTYKAKMSSSMEKALHNENLDNTLSSINKEIINEAKKAKEMRTSAINETVDMPNRGITGKHLLIGAGVVAATAALSKVTGVAGALDPGSTPKSQHDENSDVTITRRTLSEPQANTPNTIYMQNRNYSLRGNTSYGTVNDKQISSAMNIAFGNMSSRVRLNIQDNSNNDDRWFEKEISNYL